MLSGDHGASSLLNADGFSGKRGLFFLYLNTLAQSTMSIADDRAEFESAISSLQAQLANVGTHLVVDAGVRETYTRQVDAMARELRSQAQSGKISWKQAASQANETRNIIMELMRGRGTPVGRAIAESLKLEGKPLNELIAKKTLEKFGQNANFSQLTPAQQNTVYAAIVESAGKANPRVSATMHRLSRAGRGLVFVSIAISMYSIAAAEDKVDATKRELAVTGAGVGGGIVGGALAGLACGPGAPVCVTIGAFVGGALAAFGVDLFW
jgi:hypothetical protein